jgi:DNA-binding transcriptional regulator PaaX
MTTAKVLYQRWINELWAGKPVAAELVSEDFIGHWPDREVHGPDELQAIVDETQQMMSELRFVVEIEPFVDRDLVAARWIGTGAAGDGPARFTGNDILRFADGRFADP